MLINLAHATAALRYRFLGFQRRQLRLPFAVISYIERPSADGRMPLLFVHGLGTSSSSWIRVIPRLPKKRGIVCIDLPGFGFSRVLPSGQPLTMAILDESLGVLTKSVFSDKFILIGHSLGGWLSLRFAAHQSNVLSKLVLINPAGVEYPGAEEQANLFTVKNSRDVLRLIAAMWYQYPWYFRPFAGAIAKELKDRRVEEFVGSVTASDVVNPSLCSISVPVRIIWGLNDRLIKPSALQILQSSLPQSQTNLINRCGHIPQLERPRELSTILEDIIEVNDDVD